MTNFLKILAKSLIKNWVRSLGLEIVRSENAHFTLEGHLKNALSHYEIDCVIDVGANIGSYGRLLRRIGYAGWIISFEPIRSVFNQLQSDANEDPRWICYNCAIGESETFQELNVYGSSVFSSFLKVSTLSLSKWNALDNYQSELVQVKKLDNVIEEIVTLTKARNYFLKSDTQGYDLEVFRGATNCLPLVRILQSEICFIETYEGMKNPLDMMREYNHSGFLLSGFYPVNRDDSLGVIEADCIFVKSGGH